VQKEFHSLVTSPVNEEEWPTSLSGQFTAHKPLEETSVPIEQEAGWAPGSFWTIWRRERSLYLPEFETHLTHLVA
jgi:hypothetical protein